MLTQRGMEGRDGLRCFVWKADEDGGLGRWTGGSDSLHLDASQGMVAWGHAGGPEFRGRWFGIDGDAVVMVRSQAQDMAAQIRGLIEQVRGGSLTACTDEATVLAQRWIEPARVAAALEQLAAQGVR